MAWLYKQAGSKFWWIGYRQNGRQFLRSTKRVARADAEKVLAQYNSMMEAQRAGALTREFYHALTNTTHMQVSLKSALNDWLNECRGSTAEGTLARYNDVTRALVDFLKADDAAPALQDVTTANVKGFLDSIRSKRAVGTVNLYRRIIIIFFIRCVKNGLLHSNPVAPIKKYKASQAERTERRAYTLKEIQTMHGVAPSDFWRYMVLGGFFTGLRMGDLICATWANFNLNSNMIRLITAKKDKPVNIPIAPSFRQLLVALKAKAGPVKASDYLWPAEAARYTERGAGQFSNEFYDEVLLPAGLVTKRSKKKSVLGKGRAASRTATPVSFHCLRHTFVSTLKLTGAGQATAKELAGHSSDEVNDIYTHTPEPVLVSAITKLDDALKEVPNDAT